MYVKYTYVIKKTGTLILLSYRFARYIYVRTGRWKMETSDL